MEQKKMQGTDVVLFKDKFKKYLTLDSAAMEILNRPVRELRFDRDAKIVEVELECDRIIQKKDLYWLAEDMREFYGLRSFYIMVHYPTELFSVRYIPELLAETEKTGVVARGFFSGCQYTLEGEALTVRIPYSNAAVEALEDAKTPALMENILNFEFGLHMHVRVIPDPHLSAPGQLQRTKADLDRDLQTAQDLYHRQQNGQETVAENGTALRHVNTLFDPECKPEYEKENVVRIGAVRYDLSDSQPLWGVAFGVKPVSICSVRTQQNDLVILGEVFGYEAVEGRRNSDKLNLKFNVYDGNTSMEVRAYSVSPEEAGQLKKIASNGSVIALHGYTKHELKKTGPDPDLTFFFDGIASVRRLNRTDDAPVKRVELHLHTKMSNMDALIPPDEAVRQAHDWGMPAVAITDHGTCQGYQEAMKKAEELDQKVIWGIEAYFVNDTAGAVFGQCRGDLDDELIVFDIETTGLSNRTCKIIEIGAVRFAKGQVLDEFDTFVDPETPIPANITELTSITDEMVQGAPKEKEALEQFFAFIDSDPEKACRKLLVAHNADFDTGFIRVAAERCGMKFENPYLDTLSLSRYMNPKLKNHKLDTLRDLYGLGDFHHHRASDDARMLAMIWQKMTEELHARDIHSLEELQREMEDKCDPLRLPMYHQIILVKNKVGLKNLYRLVSDSYLKYYYKRPRIPKTDLEKWREGLIIGSACEAGEIFRALLDNKPENEIADLISFYDYLEIQPISNNRFLIDEGRVADEEGLRDLNRRIVALGEKYNKPVCATCDAHFMNEEDEIFRKILLAGLKMKDADRDLHLYFRTTGEMLDEFSYLGPEKAYEVVVTNTNKICDLIEKDIRPFPKGTFTPHMDGAEEDLERICYETAKAQYGDPLPELVKNRLEKELTSIIKNGFAVLYMIARKLVKYSESQGYLVGSRGSVGSSVVATFAGISEVNPLPPHYYCPKCKYSDFETAKELNIHSGFDLPDRDCPVCGTRLNYDGQDIPFETFLGFYGEKSPDIDLNFSGEVQGKVHKYTEELFGAENVFRAGTIGGLADKTAYGYVIKYLEERGISLTRAEMDRCVKHCVDVKRSTGQHPGGIVVVPKEYEIYDFCPVQHPADDPKSDIVTTHFTFSYLHDTLLKLDELGHDIPTKYKYLEKFSGTSVLDVPMNDRSIYDLFLGTGPLGVTPEEIDCELGTLGLPELGTRFVIRILQESQPQTFADLLQISGLSHGTDVWTGNAQDLIRDKICGISEVIGTRDSIMLTLIRYGLESSMAFKIMESVRKGKGLTPEFEGAMRACSVPDWYIASCKKIKYMFPKAHAAAYDMSAIRLGWYKVHIPLAFYCAMLTVQPGGFDAEIVIRGKEAVVAEMKRIDALGNDASQKDKDSYATLQLVNEAYARGIRFLPVDLKRSKAFEFTPEDGAVRMPFSALPGIGETAAQSIETARDEKMYESVEDLRTRSKVTKSVIEILRRNGILKGLDETAQISIFNLLS